jgi:cytochrome c553
VKGHRAAFRTSAGFIVALVVLLASPGRAADVEAGRLKAKACAACHGAAGNAIDPTVPSLAGQPPQFLATQLFQFREGNRKDPQMTPMAAGLSNGDLNDLAAYFAAQPAESPRRNIDPKTVAAGQRLAQQFNCIQCHGPALLGQQHIPRLAGQQPEYLRAQLRGFKAGTRADMDGTMTSAAQALSDAEIDILTGYLSGLRPP